MNRRLWMHRGPVWAADAGQAPLVHVLAFGILASTLLAGCEIPPPWELQQRFAFSMNHQRFETIMQYGLDHELAGDLDAASNEYQAAAELAERDLPPRAIALAAVSLGRVDLKAGRYDGTIRRYSKALSIREKKSGSDDIETIGLMLGLAFAAHKQGDHADGASIVERLMTLPVDRLHWHGGADHPDPTNHLGGERVMFVDLLELYADALKTNEPAAAARFARRAEQIRNRTRE